MADACTSLATDMASPATRAFAIAKSDTVDLPAVTRAIYVGGAGAVTVILVDDTDPVTFKAIPVGTTLNIRARRVMSTNTDATFMVGMY